eukprot:TRINITY_DN6151_c0_g1_i4.p1 TRINITY_DN6151_c0_g1~~TRINITY_DN6151_c0_g1_i4.p1  ORF type:complete len:720 (+),score=218.50 TRINITY_DN6151_c0_g1_i4:122-2281(+)
MCIRDRYGTSRQTIMASGEGRLSEDPGADHHDGQLTYDEVAKHNTPNDCWIIVNNNAYDVTDFMPEHPGGSGVIMEAAGQDSSEDFLAAHPVDIMKLTLGPKGLAKALKGPVDPSTMPLKHEREKTAAKPAAEVAVEDVAPPLEAILNLHDMEAVAQRVMVASGKKHAWDYYSSGADDELTYNENVNAFQRVWLKPRILVDVAEVDTSSTILGAPVSMPVYLSAVAMCGMGHKEGECSWMKAAYDQNVVFMVPNLSSRGFEDILASRGEGQIVHFQIYVNPDRDVVLEQLRACEKHGVKALCITVDSAVAGKRERDLRNKIAVQLAREKQASSAATGTTARKAGTYANRDPSLNWKDIKWFTKNTKIPIVIKGVQTAEDAVMAASSGAKAVILSNHGGRNCDTSRSGIEVLPEVIEALEEENLRKKIEVWVDGGVRRGSDVYKAIAMGADAVGLGKPAVYAMSAYGAEGISKMLSILRDELEKTMRLCGTPSLKDLNPRMVNATSLERHNDSIPIPPSPYVYKAPATNVRSPEFPTTGDKASIEAQIAKLQSELSALGQPAKPSVDMLGSVSFWLSTFVQLLRVMAVSTAKTVFSTSQAGSLHRSALFLLVFLVVHMAGNLTFLLGPEAFNGYGHKISSNPFIILIEAYLGIAFVAHVLIATLFTWRKKKIVARSPIESGKLALSGTVLLLFLVLHLKAFRFGEERLITTEDGTQMRDL